VAASERRGRDFLDNSAVPYQTTEPSGESKTADIASAAWA
jgi:hypothetical protein